MDHDPPKPMKKVHRNLFQKVGRKLEKFEQSLGIPSPNSSHGFGSTSDISSHSRRSNTDSNDEQTDATSLQYLPSDHSDSPRAVLRHKHGDRMSYPHSSLTSDDSRSSAQWQSSTEEYVEPIVKDPSAQYDQEMKLLCKDLMENKKVNLHECREYDKKISLLRMAVSFNTPKVTIPVILFLENTLSEPLLYELLKQYPSAVKNYINIAKLRLANDYYIVMLKQFNKNEDIAMIRLRQASGESDFHIKTTLLDQAAIELSTHPWWHLQIGEYQHVLNKQREFQRSLGPSQSNVQLEHRTVLETYKILYNIDFRRQKSAQNTDKSHVDRSKEMATAFHLSAEMIMCARLSVIMQCGLRVHYEDFIHQAMHQNFFGKKYIIAPENFADMVYKWVRASGEGEEQASEKAKRFLNMIHDPGRRIYYAEKFRSYDVAMDTIADVLRDRTQLEHLRRRIPQDHPSYNRATSLLENTKWRN